MSKSGMIRPDYGWKSSAYGRAEKRLRFLGPSKLRAKMKKAVHRRLRRVAKSELSNSTYETRWNGK